MNILCLSKNIVNLYAIFRLWISPLKSDIYIYCLMEKIIEWCTSLILTDGFPFVYACVYHTKYDVTIIHFFKYLHPVPPWMYCFFSDTYIFYSSPLIDHNMINWNFLGFGENESRPNYPIKGYFYQQTSYPDSKVHGANMGPIWGRQEFFHIFYWCLRNKGHQRSNYCCPIFIRKSALSLSNFTYVVLTYCTLVPCASIIN